jgi:hypothetical protein
MRFFPPYLLLWLSVVLPFAVLAQPSRPVTTAKSNVTLPAPEKYEVKFTAPDKVGA